MAKVSIIVPVYKVEKYLDRCMVSLLKQTLSDIEIILIDDGSPDNCPVLCNNYVQEDIRIRTIHKTNGGLSSARNAGLAVATGEYIGFVDSDDAVERDMYEKLYLRAKRENVDFVMCDYIRIPDDGKPYLKSLEISSGRYDKEKMKKEIYPQLIMGENLEYGDRKSVV